MAMTQDYMEYLDDQIGISPANSQEELQAAETIADMMRKHDLDAKVEEFDANSFARLTPSILFLIMFLGMLFSGIDVGALPALGMLLAVIPTVLFVLEHLGIGNGFLSKLGPTVRSQNVVAMHPATGELVTKGSRPIVIVAHYDSPHESFLCGTGVSRYVPMVRKYIKWLVLATGVCALLQVFGFLPVALRKVFWLIGIVCALPQAIEGIDVIYQRFSRCTLGANDNKASVAAMLGILENVRPTGERPVTERARERARQEELRQEQAEAARKAAEPEEIVGVRHGEDVLRELGILPASCEIVYVDHNAQVRPDETATEADEVAPDDADAVEEESSATGTMPLRRPVPSDVLTSDESEPLDESDAAETRPQAPVADMPEPDAGAEDDSAVEPAAQSDADATRKSGFFKNFKFSFVSDDKDKGSVDDSDDGGLTDLDGVIDPADTLAAEPEPAQAPESPDDPDWGKPSYRPEVSSVARRAALYDLPDPSQSSDPFGTDPNATRVAPRRSTAPTPRQSVDQQLPNIPVSTPDETLSASVDSFAPADSDAVTPSPENFDVISADSEPEPKSEKKHHFFGRKKSEKHWKGGATSRDGLRFVEEGDGGEDAEEQPSEEELREALLGMGDDELICHDIWFVALGSSEFGNAGMKAFLEEHRRSIRGAFLVNLDCVGAGQLTLLTHEGAEFPRRSDRRIGRLLTSTANDLNIDLDTKPFNWADTDATLAMRASVRSATIIGLGDDGMPALSHTGADVFENTDGALASQVTELVTEMIRRS